MNTLNVKPDAPANVLLSVCLFIILTFAALPARSAPLHALGEEAVMQMIDSALNTRPVLGDVLPSSAKSQSLAVLSAAPTSSTLKHHLLLHQLPKGLPLRRKGRISSAFGLRFHPIKQIFQHHRGIDLSVRSSTPVLSTASGVISETDRRGESGFGKYVVVTHRLGFSTLYAHLQEVNVKVGAPVAAHHVLGLSGNSGSSTAPHLHYEIRYLNEPIDPKRFILWKARTHDETFGADKVRPWNGRSS